MHQDVAAPLKLLSGGRICQISAVHNEINVSAVYIVYLVTSIGVPQMGVTDKSHAKGVLIGKLILNDGDLLRIDARLTLDVDIVGMCIERVATR